MKSLWNPIQIAIPNRFFVPPSLRHCLRSHRQLQAEGIVGSTVDAQETAVPSGGWWLSPAPLKNMSWSVGMMTFPLYGKNVPKHQPDNDLIWFNGVLIGFAGKMIYNGGFSIICTCRRVNTPSLVVGSVGILDLFILGTVLIFFLWSGWWLTYPSEKYELVSWDDDIPNLWKNNSNVPNHQPVMDGIIDVIPSNCKKKQKKCGRRVSQRHCIPSHT